MPASTIIVQHRDGSPARCVRVRLGFREGMTRERFTDQHGQVIVDHSTVGRASVYVSGRDRGSFHAPGRMAVTLP